MIDHDSNARIASLKFPRHDVSTAAALVTGLFAGKENLKSAAIVLVFVMNYLVKRSFFLRVRKRHFLAPMLLDIHAFQLPCSCCRCTCSRGAAAAATAAFATAALTDDHAHTARGGGR